MYWLCRVFMLCGLFPSCGVQGLLSSWGVQASHCGAWSLECVGFRSCSSRAPEHRLRSCGSLAQFLRSLWDLPGPGIEPVSCVGRQDLSHWATREARQPLLMVTRWFLSYAVLTRVRTLSFCLLLEGFLVPAMAASSQQG